MANLRMKYCFVNYLKTFYCVKLQILRQKTVNYICKEKYTLLLTNDQF